MTLVCVDIRVTTESKPEVPTIGLGGSAGYRRRNGTYARETHDMTVLKRTATIRATGGKWGRREVQIGLLFGAIVVTAVAGLTVALLFPAEGDAELFSYSSVARDKAFLWPFLTLAGVNIVVTVVPAGLAALVLVPARGWRWATAGFAIAVVGAALYAVGIGGWAMVYFFAADSTALDAATASAFIDSVNADAFRIFASAGFGAVLVALGVLLLSVGLWRSGNVPKWIVVVGVVGTTIPFVVPADGVVKALVESPQAVTSVLIGWYAWRLPAHSPSPPMG